MTPDQLLQLANVIGPSAIEALVRALFGRHWTTKLVDALREYNEISTTRRQRRRLRLALVSHGWDLLFQSAAGDKEPLIETVAAALGKDSVHQAESVATALESNFARSLSAQDFASLLSTQLRELRAASDSADARGTGALANQLGEANYARTVARAARFRRWRRRQVVGLSSEQISATYGFSDRRLHDLESLEAGAIVFVTAAIGSGKSDTAFEWLARHAEAAASDRDSPMPVLLRGDSIPGELETEVLRQVTAGQLAKRGARVVVDGLDEASERAIALAEQAVELVAKWPRVSVVVTSRAASVPPGVSHARVPEWTDEESKALMAAVRFPADPPSQYSWTDDLRASVRRPLFAILAAQAEEATNASQLVGELVTKSLKGSATGAHVKLAIEILRQGQAIDIRELADVAESDLDTDRLVTHTGARWQFELPIFLQWFAAHGVLNGTVAAGEYARDTAAFGRWRYVLAVALASSSAAKADEILTHVANWNPGAASWLVGEVASASLGDQSDVATSTQLTQRVASSLEALRLKRTPIANGWMASNFIRVAAVVQTNGVATVQWTTRIAGEGDTGDLVPHLETGRRLWTSTLTQIRDYSTLSPWKWNLDQLQKQLDDALHAPHLLVDFDSVIRDEFLHRAWVALGSRKPLASLLVDGRLPKRVSYNGLSIDDWTLAQLESRPDTWSRSGPWTPPDNRGPSPGWVGGNYSDEALLARSTEVYSAALVAYLELADGPFREFGDLLELRATLPARLVVRVTPADDYSPWVAEHVLPLPDRAPGMNGNSVDVSLASRADRLPTDDELAEMEVAYSARRQKEPESSLMLTRSHRLSVMDIFGPRPATSLAVSWLARDLVTLNRIGSHFRDLA